MTGASHEYAVPGKRAARGFCLLAARFALAAGLVLAVAACERRPVGRQASDPGPPVARVNGSPLYRSVFDTYLPPDYQRALTRGERREYLDRWINTELLYEEAVSLGLGPTPEVEARAEQLKKDLVADQLVQKVIREKAIVSDAEVRAYYDAHRDEYTREYRVSHIVVGSIEEAEKVKELLKKRSFSWVARRHSLDRHTGIGGDLGFLSKDNMIPEFEDVVFNMEVGQVSDVIESEFGYHIIKLTAVRDMRDPMDYEEAAQQISRALLLEKREAVYDSLITSLRARARIEVLDADLVEGAALPDSLLEKDLSPAAVSVPEEEDH